MANIDVASTRWRAIRAMFETGVHLSWIANATGISERFIVQVAFKYDWTVRPDNDEPAGTTGAVDDPHGVRRNMLAAVSRRFGALALDEAGDEETLARSMTALVKTTDAAGRLVAAFAGGGTTDAARHRSDEEVRASLRRKLQVFLGRARVPRSERSVP